MQMKYREIELQKFFACLWKRKLLIVFSGIILALFSFLVTKFAITPVYQSSVQLYVNNYESGQEETTRVLSSDLSAAQALVNTYIAIIQSDTVMEQVLNKAEQYCKLDYTVDQVRRMISASPVNGTEIFKVSVQNANPKIAAVLVNSVANTAPSSIANIIEGSSVKVIDYGKIEQSPIFPNATRNVTIGALMGLIISALISVLLELFNTTITTEEDLNDFCNLPMLGIITRFGYEDRKYPQYQYEYPVIKKGECE